MNRTISNYRIALIGITLFAMFFGAGNLIFPIMMGQIAGTNVASASIGFVSTGVLMPLLGVIALGYSGEHDFLPVAQRAGAIFGLIFVTTLYLTIGPLFAMPRTGSVSYEIAIRPFIDQDYQKLALAIFTVIYFGACCALSLNPHQIVAIIGKALTPLLLITISFLVIAAIVAPMGTLLEPLDTSYQSTPFFTGFKEGYLTMDALASLVFGIIVISQIKLITGHNSDKKTILSACTKASLIAGAILAVVYISLAYLGATSVGELGKLENGAQVLSQSSIFYFGAIGNIILGIIVMLACMTTCIGLTTACADYANGLIPTISYRKFAVFFSLVSALFANFGLTQLINFSVPVLIIIYPVTIVLIALIFLHRLFNGKKAVYIGALYTALIISAISVVQQFIAPVKVIHELFINYLPFYSLDIGWILPAIIAGIIGYLISSKVNN